LLWGFEDGVRVIYEFRLYKIDGGAVEEKSCFAMESGSPQIRRKYDDANVIFEGERSRAFRNGRCTLLIDGRSVTGR
jgi:hypothetical protein